MTSTSSRSAWRRNWLARRRAPLRRRVQAGLTPLQHTDPADFARAIHVDLTARWWLTQACPAAAVRVGCRRGGVRDRRPVRPGAPALSGRVWPGPGRRRRWCRCCRPSWARTARASAASARARCAPACARAFQPNTDFKARAPETYAAACVELLSSAAADARGRVVEID